MAGPVPTRSFSTGRNSVLSRNIDREEVGDFSTYNSISDLPPRWKPSRKSTRTPDLGSTSRDVSMRRWDGAARISTEWDGLRRDPELWFPNGNCLVHLYGRGQSRRGPAFRLPLQRLLEANCRPLLDRFLVRNFTESPISDCSTSDDGGYFGQPNGGQYELYIPPPPSAERGQAFLYHTATRNFFAWVFGRSLVGSHLGGALVGLLNSMTEFRSVGEDNVQDILDYMDEEGYADMRSQPEHALAILYFAEHFRFKDMWIDAFAHCSGMHERLAMSAGFEYMGRTSRALVTRSRLEMNIRLEKAGRMLSTFLGDDLSEAHLGLTAGARSHLDKFRSFLQSFYVAKLGYYPPTGGAFPKTIYGQMYSEFQKLYNLMVDTSFSSADTIPFSQMGGICVVQSTQAFDARHKFTSLEHPLPLLPEIDEADSAKSSRLSKRFSFTSRTDKMKPDPRLVAFSALTKATNRDNAERYDCSLVRAYREFEKECVFNPSKADKHEKLSQVDARKVRWILVYSIFQTLKSVTKVVDEVRDTQNVPYHLCVLTAGCPPWRDQRPFETLLRTQTDQTKQDSMPPTTASRPASFAESVAPMELKPDIDYIAIAQRPQPVRSNSASRFSSTLSSSIARSSLSISRRGTVRRALSSLGNMPELVHPKPQRTSFHEILVEDYGNGTNKVTITAEPPSADDQEQQDNRKNSTDSSYSSQEDNSSSRWSKSDGMTADSPRTSVFASRRGSYASDEAIKKSTQEPLEPSTSKEVRRISSSVYSQSIYNESTVSLPEPLSIKKNPDEYMRVTQEVTVEWEDAKHGEAHDELLKYLHA